MAASNIKTNNNKMPAWGEDEISRRIMDMVGVKLNFQNVNSMSTLLASQEIPDLIYTALDSDIVLLTSPDYAQPLDTLALEYTPEFWNGLDELEILANQQADGHVYSLRNGYLTNAVYDSEIIPVTAPRFMNLRTDVLDALGASMPTSVEELDALLYTAKDKMQQLGITSVLRQYSPTASPVAEWMGVKRFLQWDAEAQKIITPLRDDAWVPYLQLAARWYRDGVMTLPQTEVCWRRSTDVPWEYMTAETTEVPMFYMKGTLNAFITSCDELLNNNEALYIIGDTKGAASENFPYALFDTPLTHEGEIKYQAADQNTHQSGEGALFITNQCTNPEAAIRFVSFLRSDEGSQLVSWGVKDMHYTRTEEGHLEYTLDPPSNNIMVNDNDNLHRDKGINYWEWIINPVTEGIMHGSPVAWYQKSDHIALREMQIRAGINYKKYAAENKNPVFGLAEPEPGTDTYTQYIQLQDYWHHAVWELVTTAADSVAVAEGWEAIKAELVTRGIEDVEQAMTVRFTDALPRFQQAGYYTDIIIQ